MIHLTTEALGIESKVAESYKRNYLFWLLAMDISLALCDLGGPMFIALYVESVALLAPVAWYVANVSDASPQTGQSARGFLKASLVLLGTFFAVAIGYLLGMQRPLFW